MVYYLAAAGLLAVTLFWGWGLALLAVPRRWRRWTWVFAPGFGWALQSAVVWFGAHSPLAGTNTYARASLLLPLALLALAWRRRSRGKSRTFGLVVVTFVAGWFLLSPLSQSGPGLTSSSLGSCDHADYAAGARVFAEFSHADRTGFLGLPEVTRVRSADYFFDFWLRLNHFTPSALLAHNASTFGVEVYRLVTVTAVAVVLLNLPLVVFLARVVIGIRGRWLVLLAALYAASPLNVYAVAHGALGQLYAQQGIALLTLAVIAVGRRTLVARPWELLPLVLAAIWLLAGSYNFILTICLAPAVAWWLARAVRRFDRTEVLAPVKLVLAALLLAVPLFWGRFDGLIERFSLFEQYNFGWAVPLASPEGWIGWLRDTGLHAWPTPVRVALAAVTLALFTWGVARTWARRRDEGLGALALVVPVIAGWGILAWESRVRANASYDAYKILAVFLPGLLAGTLCWLGAATASGRGRVVAFAAGLLTLASALTVDWQFRRELSAPPLRVERRLVELGRLESEPRIGALNMKIDDYWSRLWANVFLLRKPQYFTIHTYEGRLDTPLRGDWDLLDSLLHTAPVATGDRIQVNDWFWAVRVAAPGRLEARFDRGWYAEERERGVRWRWSDGHGRIVVTNSATTPVRARLLLRLRPVAPGRVSVAIGAGTVGEQAFGADVATLELRDLVFPPGPSELRIDSAAAPAGAADPRTLGVALYGFELTAVAP